MKKLKTSKSKCLGGSGCKCGKHKHMVRVGDMLVDKKIAHKKMKKADLNKSKSRRK
jgi:hypothetical protein